MTDFQLHNEMLKIVSKALDEYAAAFKDEVRRLKKELEDNEFYQDKCILQEAEIKALKQQIEHAFNESRLTHPLVGFKHDTFRDYLNYIESGKMNLV